MDDKQIARLCHETIRTYCQIVEDDRNMNHESTGRLPDWEEAPDWMVKSAIDGVQRVRRFPETKANENHENWLAHKRREGWVHGDVKDEGKKVHPCIMPYNELPNSQKRKDSLFIGVVKACLAHS